MKILITTAIKEECENLYFPKFYNQEILTVEYLITGIGKVNSAFRLIEAIYQQKPDLVINVGTVGTVKHKLGDIFVCRNFIDRDMIKLANLGVIYQIETSKLLNEKGFCKNWSSTNQTTATCNTGDSFLTQLSDIQGDVVDMEAFAQAQVCDAKKIPFIAVKYVTDIIGQNSLKHWEDKLSDARKALSEYFKNLKY